MRKIDAYPLPAVADARSMPDTDFDRMPAAGGAQCGADRHRTTRPQGHIKVRARDDPRRLP
ncbi:hypothetical protein B7P02_24075 [Bordetella bronchiseptica]|nr:hypothetical protein BTL45_23460 [Bordetella bronchiseptica]AWP60938.1 hypothetical protein B7P02_24075 [Bordetella bronchiseptica]